MTTEDAKKEAARKVPEHLQERGIKYSRIMSVVDKRAEIAALMKKKLDYRKSARVQRLLREIRDIIKDCRPYLAHG